MTKVSHQHTGEAHFKAAAAYAECGDIHDIVNEVWSGSEERRDEFLDKVRGKAVHCYLLTIRKSTYF